METRGHLPVKSLSAGRLSYLCPLPWHSETKPSFVVYTNGDYENFYCFGCSSSHNIIHLVSYIESVPVKKVIEKLSDGFDFSLLDDDKVEQKFDVSLINVALAPSKSPVEDLAKILIEISDINYNFLKSVQQDEEERERIDKIWGIIDKGLYDYDFEKIEKIRKEIGPLLQKQRKIAFKRYQENLKKQHVRT